MAALDTVDESLGGHLPHLLYRDVNRGQHGGQILGRVDVINADQGDILGDPETVLLDGPHGADGGDIVGAEHGGEGPAIFENRLPAPVSPLKGQGNIAY